MIEYDELKATLALQGISGLNLAASLRLFKHYKSALSIWEKIPKKINLPHGITPDLVKRFESKAPLRKAKLTLEKAIASGDQILHWQDVEYPSLLRQCPDAPLILFAQGRMCFNNRPVIAVVGTRDCTNYAKNFLREFIQELSIYDPLIVSGFARGVDIMAHTTALEFGLHTVACLGHGFEKVYPAAHRRYIKLMKEQGCLLTEYGRDSFVGPMNFVSRNRIVAGMSTVTVVVESGKTGGSLITASLANSYHREVMAVPGRVKDLKSMGCNGLIQNNKAAMVTSASDLVKLMGWEQPKTTTQLKIRLPLTDPNHKGIIEYLQNRSQAHMDEISVYTKLGAGQIMGFLLELEMMGYIRALPNRHFCLS